MSYFSNKKQIKETSQNKVVAIATYEVGAEIIVKALNFYFGNTYTSNESIEMMHQNTANSLKRIADFVEKEGYGSAEIIDYLRELQEAMEAQALVVSIRDELKFDKPLE